MTGKLPTATYRLQFREGMDFDRAASLAPYFAKLGVSHLYASPLFQATTASTHGYDVTDLSRFDESLGGLDGFLRMSEALKAEGLGLVLDIVPNHMAASLENPWWRDVLRHGQASAYSRHFDIDWSAPSLLLTTLGQPYGQALEADEFSLGADREGLFWRYYDHAFPLDPRTWGEVFAAADVPVPPFLTEPERASARFPDWLASVGNAEALTEKLKPLSQDREFLDRLHEAQPWRLAYWRAARDMLTHRRFFEISDLVGLRVEDEVVFRDAHHFVFEIIEAGHIHGLRVDHVDGLADPGAYLARLATEAPCSPPIWVEKILGPGERLPPQWPVQGTTGYEFTSAVDALLIDPEGEEALSHAYVGFAGEMPDYDSMLAEAKLEIVTHNLAAELELLTELARTLAAEDLTARDYGPDTLRQALTALMAAMPVYRTYIRTGKPVADADAVVLERAEAAAAATLPEPGPLSFLLELLRSGDGKIANRFRRRLQQTTGALMAKAVEDTLFYRYNRLVALNEVGAEPQHFGLSVVDFCWEMQQRLATQPLGLSTTATHDTKRGEDNRMRIAAIADAPDAWAIQVAAFEALLQIEQHEEDAPEPNTRWLFYQALLGAWQPGVEATNLADRMLAYLVKAAREAKRETDWLAPNEAYEAKLAWLVERTLGSDGADFRRAFAAAAAPLIANGERKSLVQLALKLTLPGIPDIYQGTEFADLSLVDPDNRRPVDFAARSMALDYPTLAGSAFDAEKLRFLRRLLDLRRQQPMLFTAGDLHCLDVRAAVGRYLGFMRRHEGSAMLVIAEVSPPQATPGELVCELPDAGRTLDWQELDETATTFAVDNGTMRITLAERPLAVALGGVAS